MLNPEAILGRHLEEEKLSWHQDDPSRIFLQEHYLIGSAEASSASNVSEGKDSN